MSHAKCTLVTNRKDAIELSLVDYHLFPDCFLVGVLEGALVYCGLESAPVLVRPQSAYHVDFLARLEP